MTREIKTPADAEPREIYDETDKIEYYFTAAECVQIAEAYLKAWKEEQWAIWRTEKEHKKAAANLKTWRARFKEWLKD